MYIARSLTLVGELSCTCGRDLHGLGGLIVQHLIADITATRHRWRSRTFGKRALFSLGLVQWGAIEEEAGVEAETGAFDRGRMRTNSSAQDAFCGGWSALGLWSFGSAVHA